MYVPTKAKELGDFATDLIQRCSGSMRERIERGNSYRNMFLTGSAQGTPQTYKKTFAYIDDLASLLYSPVELALAVTPHGRAGPRERAMGTATASELNTEFRQSGVDTIIEDAVLWALIKGKTFSKLLWNRDGFEPHLVQPETFGVLEEGKQALAAQKAFFHRDWITIDDFADRVQRNPRRDALMKAVQKYAGEGKEKDESDNYAATRMVILGGLYPYQIAGSPIPGQRNQKGVVDWLSAPIPQVAPETRARQIALDELWVWNSATEDWVTILLAGADCIISPTSRLINSFAEFSAPGDKRKNVIDDKNPLRGKHPFTEFCVNRVPNYFWGDSEVRLVGSLQHQLNSRIDGINKILRKQEDPPRIISGASINQNAYAKLNKPGGYLTDPSPNLKHETLQPVIPQDMWTSIHETLGMFNDIGGMPAAVRGEGESGVRSQGHAETLVRMASPRFKDRALGFEKCVDGIAGLALDILRARDAEPLIAWVHENAIGPFKGKTVDPMLFEPPAPGMVGFEFFYSHLDNRYRPFVDNHSSSPIFSADARQLIFTLARLGAVSPKNVIELTHPPREEELIEDLETRDAEKAAYLAQHPEAAHGSAHGGRRK